MAYVQCDICGQTMRQFNAQEFTFNEAKITLCSKCWSQFDLYRYNAPSRQKALDHFLYYQGQSRCTETGNAFIQYMQNKYDPASIDENSPSPQAQERVAGRNVLAVTSDRIEGYRITKCHGLITGISAMGVGTFAGVSEWGSENKRLVNKLEEVKEKALQYAIANTVSAGANALISVKIAFDTLQSESIAIIVSGTAVTIEKDENVGGPYEHGTL